MLPPDGAQPTTVTDYWQELIKSLSKARQTALHSISRSQKKYKKQRDHKSDSYKYHMGDWVFIRYPSEETERFRKLSRSSHGPYRITSCDDTSMSAHLWWDWLTCTYMYNTRCKFRRGSVVYTSTICLAHDVKYHVHWTFNTEQYWYLQCWPTPLSEIKCNTHGSSFARLQYYHVHRNESNLAD